MSHQRRLALVLIVPLLAAGLGAPPAAADEPAEPARTVDLPCLDAVREHPGLGPACRVRMGYKVFLRDGSAIYTHGGDPPAPEHAELAHHAAKAPFCVGSTSEYHNVAIYTRPSNKADRYAEMAPKIRNMVHLANGHLHGEAVATGSGADFRFACTGGVVTVLSAALATSSSSDSFSSIISDLQALGHSNPKAKYWIWHDDLIDCGCSGIGQLWWDASRSVDNYNNGGSGRAMYAATFYESWSTMLHENGHNMGAVQRDAPGGNTLGHCNDGLDIMCYAEGGQPYNPNVCTGYARFDCNRDTYFHLEPPAGSYLATHWNIGWSANRFLQFGNLAPSAPTLSCSPADPDPGTSVTCAFAATDNSLGVHYTVEWGDGSPPQRVPASGHVAPGVMASASHAWSAAGDFTVRVRATDDANPPLTGPATSTVVAVRLRPVFTSAPCLAPGGVVETLAGAPFQLELTARSDAPDRLVSIALLSAPPGVSLVGGSGNPTSATLSWASPALGQHAIGVRATDTAGFTRDCLFLLVAKPLASSALAQGAWVGGAVPASADYATRGARAAAGAADGASTARVQATGILLEGLEERAWTQATPEAASATAQVEVTEARLLEGRVVLQGLRQDATLSLAAATGEHALATTPVIGRLVVDGVEVPLPAEPARTELPLPGGSRLVLYAASVERDGAAVVYREDLARLYAFGPYGRAEAIVGSIVLAVGADAPIGQARDIDAQDDARSGRDAGEGAGAVAIGSGVHDARFAGADVRDVYAIALRHGENVKIVAQPAPQARATGGGAAILPIAPSFPASGARVEPLRVTLVDPTGALREEDASLLTGAGARVELNADLDGTWLVAVERVSPAAGAELNYTLAATVAPVPLLPQDDARSGRDAPPVCGPDAPRVSTGAWSGVLRDADFVDVYQFEARLGEHIALVLKPGEDHDGFDAALALYDRHCALLGRSQLGIGGAKGVSEAIVRLPSLYTGTYYASIERVNGVGNHHLALAVVDPHPKALPGDGDYGADAPHDIGQARHAPPVFFQGRIDEGDEGDAYRLPFRPGQRATVLFSGSALSLFEVTLRGPYGTVIPADLFVDGHGAWHMATPLEGEHTLHVRARHAGGGYSVVWALG